MICEVADDADRIIWETAFDDECLPRALVGCSNDPFAYQAPFVATITFPFVMFDVEKEYNTDNETEEIAEWIRSSIVDSWGLSNVREFRRTHIKRGRSLSVYSAANSFCRQDGQIAHALGSKPKSELELPFQLIRLAGRDAFSIFRVRNSQIVEVDLASCSNLRRDICEGIAAIFRGCNRSQKRIFNVQKIVVRRKTELDQSKLALLADVLAVQSVVRVSEGQANKRYNKWRFSEDTEWFIPYSLYHSTAYG
ncbi:MAG: hypothetical protein AAFX06_20655 [Planctomycetota bacterium]